MPPHPSPIMPQYWPPVGLQVAWMQGPAPASPPGATASGGLNGPRASLPRKPAASGVPVVVGWLVDTRAQPIPARPASAAALSAHRANPVSNFERYDMISTPHLGAGTT